jgi:CO/xanthine dehydrogenase FAD-binding subunit
MMLPSDFELHRPTTVGEAAGLRAELGDAAALYAGGTELLLAMKLGVLDYEHLIDVKRIDALRGISRSDGELRIGALVTHRELEDLPDLPRWPSWNATWPTSACAAPARWRATWRSASRTPTRRRCWWRSARASC